MKYYSHISGFLKYYNNKLITVTVVVHLYRVSGRNPPVCSHVVSHLELCRHYCVVVGPMTDLAGGSADPSLQFLSSQIQALFPT